MFESLGKRISSLIFSKIYSKHNSSTNHTIIESTLLRVNKENTPEAPLAAFTRNHLEQHIKELNEWNATLKQPVLLDKDLSKYSTLDWIMLEKKVCQAQLTECTHLFIPECRPALADSIESSYSSPLAISTELTTTWGVSSTCIAGLITYAYYAMITPLVSGHPGLLAGLALAGGAALFWTTLFATLRGANNIFNGNILRAYIEEQLSSSWEEVFDERSLPDALLVSLLISVYKRAKRLGNPIIDFRSLTPAQAFGVLSTYYSIGGATIHSHASTPIVPVAITSFHEDICVPVPKACDANMSILIEMAQTIQNHYKSSN
jgi:hypothetical protein